MTAIPSRGVGSCSGGIAALTFSMKFCAALRNASIWCVAHRCAESCCEKTPGEFTSQTAQGGARVSIAQSQIQGRQFVLQNSMQERIADGRSHAFPQEISNRIPEAVAG